MCCEGIVWEIWETCLFALDEKTDTSLKSNKYEA